jgi:DNA polymerase-3 subunit epsilon
MFFFGKPDRPEFVRRYLAQPKIDQNLPWRDLPYSVLDIETSGLNARRDALLAIGLIEIEQGRVRLDRRWYTLVRPPQGMLVAASSIRIHGLLRDELAAAPPPDTILEELLDRLAGRVLVVHVAAIDVEFIDRILRRLYNIKLRRPILDTARLAMTLHEQEYMLNGSYEAAPLPTIALRPLAQRYNLPIYAQHNALNDAMTTAQLFLAQANQMARSGRKTLRNLVRAGGV